ncbi:MAG: UDP-N-acetylmuramoyl-tripeptide--D-alanyl-D-alanine ligase [Ruminococcaceae bacterium]|nr:UDP-N-acetylmuramoyl-tripeptide--D-alanyl-D-alanine ligase [Oscillospiraceae bacterium]
MRGIEIAAAVGGILEGAEGAEVNGISTDSRKIEKGTLFVAIRGERFDGNAFIDAAFAAGATVVLGNEEAVPPSGCAYIRVSDSVEALGRLAAWHRQQFSIPVVGITGSVGKTTTKEMIAAVLSAGYNTLKTAGNFNNHIGLPLTVLGLTKSHGAAVIEMGMSARGEIAYLTKIAKPTVAVITNVGLSHIETLKTQENIRDAKLEIAEGLPVGGTLLVNGDDAFLKTVQLPGIQVKRFGFDNPDCEIRGEVIDEDCFLIMGTVIRVPVPGRHNMYNALAAVAAGLACGITPEKAAAGLCTYKTDGVRQTEVEIRPGIRVLCDYYNASPASMSVALEMLKKGGAMRRIAVIGDMLELGEIGPACHREVGEKAARLGIDMLLSVGPLARLAAEAGAACGMETRSFADNDALAEALSALLTSGDRVLIKGSHGMKMEQIFEKIR